MDKNLLLSKIKNVLQQHFPELVEEVILFGSRVYGQPTEHSDYDILIVLKEEPDWKLENTITDTLYKIELENDLLLDIKILSHKALYHSLRGKQPVYKKALTEGIRA